MKPEQFIHEFDALSPDDKKRVLMAIGPAFCRELMSHPDLIMEMRGWCRNNLTPGEMQDMMGMFRRKAGK